MSKYQAWADELEAFLRADLPTDDSAESQRLRKRADNRVQWFRGRFIDQLEYHTNNSRKSKSRYWWLALAMGLVPIVANTVMSLSSMYDQWLRFGIICGILAIGGGAALALIQTLGNNQQNWQASRELAEQLKAQYWDLIGDEGSDFDARWVNFHNDVERLLATELTSFGARAKVAQIAAQRLQRQADSQLAAAMDGTKGVVSPIEETSTEVAELKPIDPGGWPKWQATQLADEEFADVTQELPRGIR